MYEHGGLQQLGDVHYFTISYCLCTVSLCLAFVRGEFDVELKPLTKFRVA